MAANHEDRANFHELLDDFDMAMLVTARPDGELRARPMALAGHLDDGSVWFATDRASAKSAELQLEPRVALTAQSGSKYLSLSGVASLSDNRARIDEFYSPAWKVWFPEGKDDPSLTLIRVEPTHGEYWDQSGSARLEFLWEAGKAVLQGKAMDTDSLSGHAKVNF